MDHALVATGARVMVAVGTDDDQHRCSGGFTAKRECGLTPNGNPMAGRWVLRDAAGSFVDFDQYRTDLFERNQLKTSY